MNESKTSQPTTEHQTTLKLDLGARRVWKGEQEIELTKLEHEVIEYLARRAGQNVPYAELWQQVWRDAVTFGVCERDAVRAVIKRLRKKLGKDPKQQDYLATIRGVGVRLRRWSVQVTDS